MNTLGPYAFYIVCAYGSGALGLAALFGATWLETRKLKRALKALSE